MVNVRTDMARTDDTTNQCPEMVAEAQREENAGEAFDDTILLMVVNDDLVRSGVMWCVDVIGVWFSCGVGV